MVDNIDIRVSPALHQKTVQAMEGYNDQTRGYVADVESTYNDWYVTLGKLHDAAELWRRNPATTRENAILIVSKEADKHRDRLAGRMDRAMANLKKGIEQAETELSQPIKERAGLGNLNVEVRGHVKGLKHDERRALLNDAFEAGDVDTLHAVLGAQPFLSGCPPWNMATTCGACTSGSTPTSWPS